MHGMSGMCAEVDHFYDWFQPQLARVGYEGVFKKKPKSPCLDFCDLEDGCCVFVRTDRCTMGMRIANSEPERGTLKGCLCR